MLQPSVNQYGWGKDQNNHKSQITNSENYRIDIFEGKMFNISCYNTVNQYGWEQDKNNFKKLVHKTLL